MSLLDLPMRVAGGAFRVATLPLRLVLGGGGNDAPPAPPPAPSRPEPEAQEMREQEAALRDAVRPDPERARDGQALKDATERAKEERRRTTGDAE